ncbi:dolichyl-phosphate-mannose--protein mannosyltransferase [Sphingomonas spermidinifaciens]|uniref:Polyprenol-phosphate-mannose--protein mannosyltransferase n=1 Tax=Sphingomonas spermidinifaciens TaxID=1141889 RepID=A0A2A4B0M6_9SPHN|nr:phospholipid carrier-dependent glycosyltransferase [Sphingomonas spermidinifaciens]PCD01597.1 dolichyl-phosphate-mannose--protein mannosyltransferase [Sphingomonas spermidinifaciens]
MRLAERPTLLALIVAAAALLLFALNLDRPAKPVFDEVHYVPAARAMLALSHPANTEHPPLAKELIAVGMAVFGDNPVGWRAVPALAGAVTVAAGFAFLFLLVGSTRTALFGALFIAINQTVFIQARIAMLDGFLGAFVTGGLAATLWAMKAPPGARGWRVALAGLLLGAGVAVKWAAAPYVALACVAVLAFDRRPVAGLGLAIPLGLVAIATYFATFVPSFYYAADPVRPDALVDLQRRMYEAQTQILQAHPYQSDWWSWPLMLRPIWYFYEPDMGVQRGVLLIGNPAIMWGGLVAIAACLWVRGPTRVIGGLWLFSILIWAAIPKSLGFYYYYHLSGIFAALACAAGLSLLPARWRWIEGAFAALAIGLFLYFYPIISGAALSDPQDFNHWMWMNSWR